MNEINNNEVVNRNNELDHNLKSFSENGSKLDTGKNEKIYVFPSEALEKPENRKYYDKDGIFDANAYLEENKNYILEDGSLDYGAFLEDNLEDTDDVNEDSDTSEDEEDGVSEVETEDNEEDEDVETSEDDEEDHDSEAAIEMNSITTEKVKDSESTGKAKIEGFKDKVKNLFYNLFHKNDTKEETEPEEEDVDDSEESLEDEEDASERKDIKEFPWSMTPEQKAEYAKKEKEILEKYRNNPETKDRPEGGKTPGKDAWER